MTMLTISRAAFAAVTICAAACGGAALAQTGGAMAAPAKGSAMSSDHMAGGATQNADCPKTGAMSAGHMSGNTDNHMSDGNHMSGGAMASNAGCKTDKIPKTNP
jgi:hypothetical protein